MHNQIHNPLLYLIFIPIIFAANSTSGTAIYYVSPTGSDSASGALTAPFKTIQKGLNTLHAGDTLYIRGGVYKEKLVLDSSGTAYGYITVSGYPGEQPVIDGAGIPVPNNDGLIKISGGSFIKLSNLTVRNSAEIGVYLTNTGPARPTNNILSGLTVLNSGDAAIKAQRVSYLTVEKSLARDCVSSGIGIWTSDHVEVDGNTIINCRWKSQAAGGHEESLTISKTNNFEVLNNELYFEGSENSSPGITVKQSSFQGSVHHNYLHDFPEDSAIYVDAEDAGLNGTPTLHDVDVYANRIERVTSGINVGSEWNDDISGIVENVNIYNNLITQASYTGIRFGDIHGNGPRKNIHVYNNTIYDSGGSGGAGVLIRTTNIQNIIIRNNIVVPGPTYTTAMIKLGVPSVAYQVTADHNIVLGSTICPQEFPNCVNFISGNIQLDPQFVNAPGGDFHLKSNSPAINAGVTLSPVTTDFDGVSRPQGPAYDIGAYEYHPASTSTSSLTITVKP
jgi:hypothetical protein